MVGVGKKNVKILFETLVVDITSKTDNTLVQEDLVFFSSRNELDMSLIHSWTIKFKTQFGHNALRAVKHRKKK